MCLKKKKKMCLDWFSRFDEYNLTNKKFIKYNVY